MCGVLEVGIHIAQGTGHDHHHVGRQVNAHYPDNPCSLVNIKIFVKAEMSQDNIEQAHSWCAQKDPRQHRRREEE